MERAVININTLQIWKSIADCAKFYNISSAAIFSRINSYPKYRRTTALNQIEYLDVYLDGYSAEEKRKNALYSNIDFFNLE